MLVYMHGHVQDDHLFTTFPGKDLPDKPTRAGTSRTVRLNAQLQERCTTARGSEYVRLTFYPENVQLLDGFGKGEGEDVGDPADVIDAEFMFLTGMQESVCEAVWLCTCFLCVVMCVSFMCVISSISPTCVLPSHFPLSFLTHQTGDRIVNVRASSRAQPTARQGRFQLSLENGIVFDRNRARQRMEGLRQVLCVWLVVCMVDGVYG